MSKTFHRGERRIRARGIRQDPPDLRRIARTLIALAEAQAEADAQSQAKDSASKPTASKTKKGAIPPSARTGEESA